ncbi:MAG: hypothetical protein N2257_09475 [Thermodesulfovibrionales bacterium]|nr:hypothetical protein [Thermodesulfovibrionales bacterium]
MTIYPFQLYEMMHLYGRASKLKNPSLLEKDEQEPKDVVNISSEAKKKQIIEETKKEVLHKIRQ